MKSLNRFFLALILFVGQLSLAAEPLKLGSLYPTTPMRESYIGEVQRKGIIYLTTTEEREPYRVTIRNGIAYTAADDQPYKMTDSMVNYVMDAAGNFYFFQNEILVKYRHSSMFAGEPVAAAGEVVLDANGKIIKVNRSSGHYRPAQEFFANALKELGKSGVEIAKNRSQD